MLLFNYLRVAMWLLGLQVQSALLSSSVDAKLIETGNGLQDLVSRNLHRSGWLLY